jgi:hypothetical protein
MLEKDRAPILSIPYEPVNGDSIRIGMIQLPLVEEYTLTLKRMKGLPRSFILEADSIDRLLLSPGRHLLGAPRMFVASQATQTWCRALREQKFLPDDSSQLCSMTVLAEGFGHNLPGALAAALAPEAQAGDNFMGISRFALPRSAHDEHTPFDAEVKYLRIESPAPVWVMLDTVATGATLLRGLEAAFAQLGPNRPRVILLGTPAGSAVGMQRIAEWGAARGVELTIFFFGAVFGLWQDGTALPWCHPRTMLSGTPRSLANRALAARLFNNLEGFCSVGDCSANFFDVRAAARILQQEQERFGWNLLGS